jgi:glycosyltransferase involved in cell wall biosynthesis
MRPIALILDRFDPCRGGLESYALFLLERFRQAQGEALLLTGPAPIGVPQGVTVQEIQAKGEPFYTEISKRACEFEDSHILLSLRHPGRAAEVFLPLGGLFRDALDARRESEPFWKRLPARLVRQISWRSRFFLKEERRFFETDKGLVLCSSPMVADRIRANFPFYNGRVEITGLPVDPIRFALPDPGEKKHLRETLNLPSTPAVLILWVGNDPKRKGLTQALSVLKRLRQRKLDAYLLCLGRSLPKSLGRQPYCILRRVSDSSPYYQTSDIFLLPTFEDNYSISVLEALACGLPVVTTLANGAHIHLQEWANGKVISDPHDLDALDSATLSLLQDLPQAPLLRRTTVTSAFEDTHFDRLWGVLKDWENQRKR